MLFRSPVDVSSLKTLPRCHGEHTSLQLPCPMTAEWYILLVKHVLTISISVKHVPYVSVSIATFQHSENRNPVFFHFVITASDA